MEESFWTVGTSAPTITIAEMIVGSEHDRCKSEVVKSGYDSGPLCNIRLCTKLSTALTFVGGRKLDHEKGESMLPVSHVALIRRVDITDHIVGALPS